MKVVTYDCDVCKTKAIERGMMIALVGHGEAMGRAITTENMDAAHTHVCEACARVITLSFLPISGISCWPPRLN